MRAYSCASIALFTVFAAVFAPACAPATESAQPILPLKSLRLYETGVGYFERSGKLDGAPTSLPVPAGHLDDALASLVVLRGGKQGSVHGVEFSSSISRGMARALAGLPLDADTPVTYRSLIESLKGAHVEVSVQSPPDKFMGRVVDVIAQEPAKDPKAAGDDAQKPTEADDFTLLVLTDRGEMKRVRANALSAVRPTDAALVARLGSALDALSDQGARETRLLRVLGDTDEPLTLGYVAEAPIFRTTYRLVLTEDGKGGTLQGWALIHNDTDENWGKVKVDLVNGRPDSFLFPLAAPRYARRELVKPEGEASTVPQLLSTTVDRMWGDNIEDASGSGGLALSGRGEGGGGTGYGIGFGSIGTIGHGSGAAGSSTSTLLAVGNLASVAEAQGVESGALFAYTLAEPLDLRAHGSALVPFVDRSVVSEQIAWFASTTAEARAAVRFVNATPQTLPAGPITVFAAGGFAGETALDRLKPNERRFLAFGADPDLSLETRQTSASETTKRVVLVEHALVEHYLRDRTVDWTLENRSGQSRSAYVALGITNNSTITGLDSTDFDAQSNSPLGVVKVPARQKILRPVHTVEGLERPYDVDALNVKVLERMTKESALTQKEKDVLADAVTKQKAVEEAQATAKKAAEAIADAEKDVARLREDLKALGGEKGQAAGRDHPFVQRVLAAEDQLAKLKKTVEVSNADVKTKRQALLTTLTQLKE